MAVFQFSDFNVCDDHCGQKICSDSVLFAAWAWKECPSAGLVLDVGTGSGVLALISARECPEARVTAIELAPGACEDARMNFVSSPWSSRLTLFEGSYDVFEPSVPADAIICNPPFFNEGARALDSARAGARHEGRLSYTGVIRYSARVLSRSGRLFLLGPDERSGDVVFSAELAGLKLRRHARIKTAQQKAPARSFWEFTRPDGSCREETISIRDAQGNYTTEYLDLVGHLYHHLS